MTSSLARFNVAFLLLCVFLSTLLSRPCVAATDTAFHVRLDISPLSGLGLFNAEFQLIDGSGTGNNSLVTIKKVELTNAMLGAVLPPRIGNADGDLSSALVLRDGPMDATADFAQGFSVIDATQPAFFDFDVTLTYDALEPSATFDNFSFLLLNEDGSQTLPTDGPTGGEVAAALFDRATPQLSGYASAQGSNPFLTAPTITPLNNTPEPASVLYLAFSSVLSGVGTMRVWRGKINSRNKSVR